MSRASVLLVSLLVACSGEPDGSLTLQGSGRSDVSAARIRFADSGIDPAREEMQIAALWASTSPLCTEPVLVFENHPVEWADMLDEPVLGQGPLADGTYPCVIAIASDWMRFAPAASSDSGNCQAGVVYEGDICHAGSDTLMPTGETVDCRDDTADLIALYLSTAGAPLDMARDVGHPPESKTDTAHGLRLESPLVVAGDTLATFYNDASGSVRDTGDTCEMGATRAGFRQDP
jgi:hypothetical protein